MKKYIILFISIIILILGFISFKSINNQSVETYPVKIPYKMVHELSNIPNEIIQWIKKNKIVGGLFTMEFDGKTYIMYSMGEQTIDGYAFKGINLNKTSKNQIILSFKKLFTKDICIPTDSYYPTITLQVEGKLNEKINVDIEEVINIKNE